MFILIISWNWNYYRLTVLPAWLCTQNGAEKRSRILTTSVIWSFCVCCVRFCANYNNNKNWVTSGSNYITKKPLVIFGFCRDFLVVCTGTAQMISCQKVIFTNSSFPHSHIILKGSLENSQIWAFCPNHLLKGRTSDPSPQGLTDWQKDSVKLTQKMCFHPLGNFLMEWFLCK